MLNRIVDVKKHSDFTTFMMRQEDYQIPFKVAKVWCGMVWPNYPVHPAYYCIFTEDYMESGARGRLKFVSEGESRGMYVPDMLKRLTDILSFLKCDTIYADDENEQYVSEFREYMRVNDLHFSLLAATHAGNILPASTVSANIRKTIGVEFEKKSRIFMEISTWNENYYNTPDEPETLKSIYPVLAYFNMICSYDKYGNNSVDAKVRKAMNKHKIKRNILRKGRI